jgi:hypothetical protein
MGEAKTKETDESVSTFLNAIKDQARRDDCITVAKLMEDASGFKPKMWGANIVGFGSYHYKYESGREGDSPLIAFSPRKQNLTLYVLGFEKQDELLTKLGKHSIGNSCLYIKSLSDVHLPALKKLLKQSFQEKKKLHN